MNPVLGVLGDSVTFIEDQLESTGFSPFDSVTQQEAMITSIANLAARLLRLRLTPEATSILQTIDYQSVADCFCRVLHSELQVQPSVRPVGTALTNFGQLSLFPEDQHNPSTLSSAA
jgi:hypothetical protein